jgi:hypothetical protein
LRKIKKKMGEIKRLREKGKEILWPRHNRVVPRIIGRRVNKFCGLGFSGSVLPFSAPGSSRGEATVIVVHFILVVGIVSGTFESCVTELVAVPTFLVGTVLRSVGLLGFVFADETMVDPVGVFEGVDFMADFEESRHNLTNEDGGVDSWVGIDEINAGVEGAGSFGG